MAIKRLHYFDHQFLIEADFTDEQTYHLSMRRRLNNLLYTDGIAQGLEVAKSAPKTVTVRPGAALDNSGREIILEANQVVDLSAAQFSANVTVFITIAYQEQESDPTPASGVSGNTRITELPQVRAVTTAPPTGGTVIQLASFRLDASGNVPGNINDLFDGNVRQTIRPRAALTSIQGISSPLGNVGLIQGTGIIITPNQANRNITIASSVTQGLASVNGVSNPGANIDLVALPTQAIVITPNDATNQITFSLTAADLQRIGGMLASDYDLRQRQLAIVTFNSAGDALTQPLPRTINLGFQTRIVLVVGTCTATLGSLPPQRVYGGGVSAFADLESNPTNLLNGQRGFGISVTRFSNTDWFSLPLDVDGIARAIFTNNETTPPQGESFSVAITAVSATTIEATLTRSLTAPANARVPGFAINLKLLCMG